MQHLASPLEIGPTVAFSEVRFRAMSASERAVCFTLEDAAPGAIDSVSLSGGRVRLVTRLRGIVRRVEATSFELEHSGTSVRIRQLLPLCIDLSALEGHEVVLDHWLTCPPDGRATVDVALRDSMGRVILWARDGEALDDQPSRGFVLRLAYDPSGAERLAFVGGGRVAAVGPKEWVELELPAGRYAFIGLRVENGRAAFVVARTE